ncbi:MAG: hypothetical protein U1E42_01140 [Rhodospirillales bacterium]
MAVLAYANSFSLWHYDTEDDVEEVLAPGYFDEMTKLARRGDLVFVSRRMSGSPQADLLLVTEVGDNGIRIEALQRGGEAHDLAALHDVRLRQPEAEQVLAFDGETWVNRPNAGAAGDAHAALRGNPHNTSSTDVGAVPAAEKGAPGGLATLDVDGCVPLAQLRNLALANLREIVDSHPEIGFVLRFDGTTWVASPETGQAGDAHACLIGNPHHTTASDVGAVTVAEKGVAGGVASLGADGKVPAEQLPPAGAADQIVDTPTKVMMTTTERSKLAAIEEKATAAGAVGDAFAACHGGAGGDAHATACANAAGFLSPVDKVKLDGIAEGATRNPALATQEEVASGTGTDARLLTPALIKQAVITHTPPAAADTVTNAALANMTASRIKGRANTAGTGDPQDLTPVQVRTIINVADGATAAGVLGDSHAAMTGNPHQTSADQVGAVSATEKGVANGVATLDATGKIPAGQLPPGSGGAIATVFGRTGTVLAQANDYNAGQVLETANAKIMTASERSKLASIESAATADQTGAEIVTAINTELGGTTWQGGGAIATVFGRTGTIVAQPKDYNAEQILETASAKIMTASERSKLASIESAATADQTGAEIVTAINTELGGTTWQGGGDGSFTAEEIVQLKRYAASAEAYTATATNVGATSDRVHWKGSAQGSLTLSTSLAHKRVTVTNKGTAPVNVITGLGTFTLPVAAEPGQPSSFCFSREANTWQMV